MSRVDINTVHGEVVLSTGNATTTRVNQNENLGFKNLESRVVVQLGIRPNNSYTYTTTQNKNSVFFDGYSQAKGIQDRLTSNIEKTAGNFLDQQDLKGNISAGFKTQLESLSKCYKQLQVRVGGFSKLSQKERFNLGSALAEINGLLYRLNNDSVGGINKLDENKFQESTMWLIGKKALYKKAQADAESDDPSVRESGKRLTKFFEEEALPTEEVAKKNLDALGENLRLLEEFSKSPPENRSDVEKMLNFIQQCALSAWVFNDVAKVLTKKAGFFEKDLVDMGILSEKNEEMKVLNKKARDTTMFKEFAIDELIKDAKLTGIRSVNKDVDKFLNKWGNEKIGFRGRHGIDTNDERVSSRPIGNIKDGVGTFQDGSLFEKIIRDQNFKGAIVIKGSVVPHETANLKTVPHEMLEDLKRILNTEGGQAIAGLLKKEGLIEATVTSIGGVFRLSDLEAKPSFASFINDAGLPTYCSVSGTTGEIVSV